MKREGEKIKNQGKTVTASLSLVPGRSLALPMICVSGEARRYRLTWRIIAYLRYFPGYKPVSAAPWSLFSKPGDLFLIPAATPIISMILEPSSWDARRLPGYGYDR